MQIVEGRSKLPIASFMDVITSTIESHQVMPKVLESMIRLLVSSIKIALDITLLLTILYVYQICIECGFSWRKELFLETDSLFACLSDI